MDKSVVANNIRSRRKELKLTLQEVADKVGVAASTVQRYENGTIGSLKMPVIAAIAKALGVLPEWICGTSTVKEFPRNAEPADFSDLVQIPVIGRVAAGIACHAEENIERYEYVPGSIISENHSYVFLRVVGDSMCPKIQPGDLVLVRCQEAVDNGDYAVVLIDNEDGVVKRVHYGRNFIELISENPYYPPRRFEGAEMSRLRIFGKVMESRRKF